MPSAAPMAVGDIGPPPASTACRTRVPISTDWMPLAPARARLRPSPLAITGSVSSRRNEVFGLGDGGLQRAGLLHDGDPRLELLRRDLRGAHGLRRAIGHLRGER